MIVLVSNIRALHVYYTYAAAMELLNVYNRNHYLLVCDGHVANMLKANKLWLIF